MDSEPLLTGLTTSQHQAVVTDGAPVCILAAAGAGKTRVLTRRIAYRIATDRADAGHVLALTFTRKAAGQLADRLQAVGVRDRVTAGTFHGIAYAQLRQYWADRGEPAPALLDRKARLLGRLVSGRTDVAAAPLRDLAAEIEWAQARLVAPEQYAAAAEAAGRRPPVPAGAVAALYARYESEKQRRRLADFDDLLARCAAALERDAAFAAVQRWRWRHVFVDEFQDVNPLQYRLLTAWLGDRTDLCVVGDPNQSIYGWNGADPALLSNLRTRWPDTEVVRLDDNHRCTPQVVAAAAAVLGPPGAALRSARPDGPRPAVRAYPTDRDEAHGVAAEIQHAHASGLPWSQMAVLTRINAQAVLFEAAFRAARIPYRVAGSRALLDDPDVRVELAALAGWDSRPFAMVVADLATGATAGTGATGGTAGADGRGRGGEPADAAERAASPGAKAARAALASMARDFQLLDQRPTVAGFLAWLGPATGRDRTDEPGDRVTLCSFHRAKGLEWAAVWVTGLEHGLVPISHATTPEAEQEERRLLYVALTRAARDLHCSWAQQRTLGERAVPRQASPWLRAISATGADAIDAPGERQPLQWRQQLAAQRDRLAGCHTPGGPGHAAEGPQPDPEVIDSLRCWRAGAARAAGVPAHVLFHDATLAAIALTRPSSAEELLGVPGLGPVKVARYGSLLLDVLARPERSVGGRRPA